MNSKILFLLVILITTVGCSTWTEERCATADWERVGEDDGDAGRTPDAIEHYAEQCARHGIAPDEAAYSMGYTGGRDDYCTRRGGYNAGSVGQPYRGICAEGFADDFLEGHRIGWRVYQADVEISQLSGLLRQLELELGYNRSLPDNRRLYYQQQRLRLRQQIDRAVETRDRAEREARKLLAE